MNGIEGASAIGEIVGGAGAAKAIEPGSEGKKGHERPDNCLNCGAALQGDYCHECGQKGHLHRTLGGLLHDMLHGVLHLDGKFWRTLPALIWRPGRLTRDYIEGKRARFISPIAIYLFTVVAMFALVVSVDISDQQINTIREPAATIEQQRERVAELEANLEELENADFPGVSGAMTGVRAELDLAQLQLEAWETGGDPAAVQRSGITFGESGIGMFDEQIAKAEENPGLYLYKVQTAAYKLSWLLIPLSLPFLWLLFPISRRFKLYDHAVFVTYSISFMMLLAIIVNLMTRTVGWQDWFALLLVFIPPIHIYRHFRGTYGLGRLRSLAGTFYLSIISIITLSLFLALMLTLGVIS
ncbi:DUF3667 domain-containing protein [Sphingomicrobium sediminis]|uniref:DUF3667 domain-containing protein n=1 Tax=Sphingomicrobium sediminis TaxID=2950949 RepID=A0A9X2EHK2_9SPHN|nr:DUF3667 domain-containing protein [Sphingomicrobium sediminis]MCM8557692.1 DUF3667 domain-containing protein [Sphingomicrobium sediminis]